MASGGLTGHSCHRHRRRSPGNPASGPIASWGARGTCPTEVLSRCTERRIRPSPRTAPPPARCSKRITASVPRVFRHLQYSSQKGLHRGRRGGGATSFTRICGSICSEAGSCFGDPGHPFRRSWTPVPAILDTRSGQSWTPVPAILDTRSGDAGHTFREILDTRSGQSWTPVPTRVQKCPAWPRITVQDRRNHCPAKPPDMGAAGGYVKRGPEIAVSRHSFAPLAPAYARRN
jgi:hypothetical protein